MNSEHTTPDPLDYAARAKALMKNVARAGALVILPIGLAVSAHASVVLPTPSASCSLPLSGCGASITQLPDQGGLEGFTISATDQGVGLGPSGGTTGVNLDLGTSGLLTMNSGGSNCNGVGMTCDLPSFVVSWDATVSGGGYSGGGFLSWTGLYNVSFSLDGNTIFTTSGAASSGADASTESLSGSAVVNIPTEFENRIADLVGGSGGGNVSLDMTIQTVFNGDGQNYTSVTYQSADFTVTEPAAATPEPATRGLMLSSLLGLGSWLGLRRRKRA